MVLFCWYWYLQALDVGSLSVDEPSVKVEQENVNKPAD